MLLPFSININNKPTYFVEKIWAGFALNQIDTSGIKLEHIDRAYYEVFGDSPFDYESDFKPKLHTIRKDVHNRWKEGMLIEYFINARKKKHVSVCSPYTDDFYTGNFYDSQGV